MHILVMGDSYSAGNGAGSYYGASGCFRSHNNYGEKFAAAVRTSPYYQPADVTTVACSGAVSADFTHPKSGRPPEVDAVSHRYDVIFLTDTGNDARFADIVKFCLIALTRDGANCGPLLTNAEHLAADTTSNGIASRLTTVLKAVAAKASPAARIVVLGYPYLEGDLNYTLRSGHYSNTFIHVGTRLHALNDASDRIESTVVTNLNKASAYSTQPFQFVSTHALFNGPPYHGLYAMKNNPYRWFIQPGLDVVTAHCAWYPICYHPNPTGWSKEGGLLVQNARVPKLPQPVITTTTLPASVAGHPYSTQLTTADHRTGTWKVVTGSLPAGLTLTGYTIAGTPTVAQAQPSKFTLQFTDRYGTNVRAVATLAVQDGSHFPLTITTAAPPGAKVWQPLTAHMTALGGQGPYTWAFTPGSYPYGLSLTPAGDLSGTLNSAGTTYLSFTVTDAYGRTGSASWTFPAEYGDLPTIAGTWRQVTDDSGTTDSGADAISPDGQWVTFWTTNTALTSDPTCQGAASGAPVLMLENLATATVTCIGPDARSSTITSDDNSVVYETYNATGGIERYDIASATVTTLVPGSSRLQLRAVSADGSRLAYTTYASDTGTSLYVLTVATGDITAISTGGGIESGAATFSSDGSTLAYATATTASNYVPFLHVRDMASGTDSVLPNQSDGTLSLSGDGQYLAYETYKGYYNPGEAVIDLHGGGTQFLDKGVNGVYSGTFPAAGHCMLVGSWEMTALTSDLPNRGLELFFTDLYTYDLTSGTYTRVTNTLSTDVRSVWGEHLAVGNDCGNVAFSATPSAVQKSATSTQTEHLNVYLTTLP